MLLERSFVISHNLYIVEWVYIVLKRYTHKYRLLIWNLSIEKHYQSWLYLWNCCNKSDVALFSVSTQSIKYKVKSLYRYMLKSVFFQVPGGKACNEFLFLNLVSVYFKLIKEWEKTRGAGHFWRFKFWSTLIGRDNSTIRKVEYSIYQIELIITEWKQINSLSCHLVAYVITKGIFCGLRHHSMTLIMSPAKRTA